MSGGPYDVVHVYDGHTQIYDGRGSLPTCVWNIAKHVSDVGSEVLILERQWAGLPARERTDGVDFRRVDLRTGPDEPYERIPYEMVGSVGGTARLITDRINFAVAVLRVLTRLKFDVLHVHLPFAANVIATAAPWLRKRMVYTAHIGETDKRVRQMRLSPDVILAKQVAKCIVLNEDMRQAFLERGVPASSLSVVPNGVNVANCTEVPAEERRRQQSKYGIGETSVVLFAGTITPRKGVKELVTAASDVIAEVDSAHFVFVGKQDVEPAYMQEVRSRVAQLGVEEAVTFTGFVSNEALYALFDIADVFVLPSYEEGSSIAVAEAIATATPVVGTDIEGITHQIDEGTHGRLVPPGDVAALETALTELLTDPARREQISANLRSLASERSWDTVTQDIRSVYREVVE